MSESLKQVLLSEFADKAYAHSYMHTHLLERLAAQIYATRANRELSQVELAKLSKIPQAKLSKLECAEVESFTLATLLKLAKALDVAVNVEFEPFSCVARRADAMDSVNFAVPSRAADLTCAAALNSLLQPMWTTVPVSAPSIDEAPVQIDVQLKDPQVVNEQD